MLEKAILKRPFEKVMNKAILDYPKSKIDWKKSEYLEMTMKIFIDSIINDRIKKLKEQKKISENKIDKRIKKIKKILNKLLDNQLKKIIKEEKDRVVSRNKSV